MLFRKLTLSGVFFVLLVANPAFAVPAISAIRQPGRSYLDYINLYNGFKSVSVIPGTPLANAKKYKQHIDLARVRDWGSLGELYEHFDQIRDNRWIISNQNSVNLRRPSWLYPDDGCFARAALAVKRAIDLGYPAPGKIFVFGDISVKTPNTKRGHIEWWFHVAPVVQVGGYKYVLDPSLEPSRPLPVHEWLSLMTDDPETLEVAICSSGTYLPASKCESGSDGVEAVAMSDQIQYLSYEWDRLVELGRNPEQELGDSPPWKSQ